MQFPLLLTIRQAVDTGATANDATGIATANDAMANNSTAHDTFISPLNDNDNGDDDSGSSNDETGQILGRQGTARVVIPPFEEEATPPISYIATKPHKQKEEKKKKRKAVRCRQCGHVTTDEKWVTYHREEGFKPGKRSRPCTVKESERNEGFPLPSHIKMSSVK